jgi:hypothetical protein
MLRDSRKKGHMSSLYNVTAGPAVRGQGGNPYNPILVIIMYNWKFCE